MEGSDWGGKEGQGREMEAENFTEMAWDNSGLSHSGSKGKVLENKLSIHVFRARSSTYQETGWDYMKD